MLVMLEIGQQPLQELNTKNHSSHIGGTTLVTASHTAHTSPTSANHVGDSSPNSASHVGDMLLTFGNHDGSMSPAIANHVGGIHTIKKHKRIIHKPKFLCKICKGDHLTHLCPTTNVV
jgi:hypothetical protein